MPEQIRPFKLFGHGWERIEYNREAKSLHCCEYICDVISMCRQRMHSWESTFHEDIWDLINENVLSSFCISHNIVLSISDMSDNDEWL